MGHLAAAQPGARLSDVGAAVEAAVNDADRGYGILRDYVGRGIGSRMHMEPAVANFGPPGRGPRLKPGMAIAVEPMVTLGSPDVFTHDDDWTVSTLDRSIAAHWEHTVAITDDGPWVLTALDGGSSDSPDLGPCISSSRSLSVRKGSNSRLPRPHRYRPGTVGRRR